MTAEDRITRALSYVDNTDGAHHKQWTIDQMLRALLGCPMVEKPFRSNLGKSDPRTDADGYLHYTATVQGESPEYLAWVAAYCDGEDGPGTYEWDEGIAP